MLKRNFKEYHVDNRIAIIKKISKDFFTEYWNAQWLLSIQNPVIKIYPDGVCVFEDINELNEFYFLSQCYTDEDRSLQMRLLQDNRTGRKYNRRNKYT